MENSSSHTHPAALLQGGRFLWLLSTEEWEVAPGKPDSHVYKGMWVGYRAVGESRRRNDEVELLWDRVESGSWAAPGEESPLGDP